MAVQLNIPYETLVALVEQLPEEQQRDLMQRLQMRTRQQGLTVDGKMKLLRAAQIHAIPWPPDVTAVNEESSPRREDWHDDGERH